MGKVLSHADIPRNGQHIKIADAYKNESMGGDYLVTGATIIAGHGDGVCDIFSYEKADRPERANAPYVPKTTLTTLLKPNDYYDDFSQPLNVLDGYIVCRESLDGWMGREKPSPRIQGPAKRKVSSHSFESAHCSC